MSDSVPNPSKYAPNSNTRKTREASDETPKKKPEKIITGEVVQRKPSLAKRIIQNFTGDDVHSVGSYVLFEVAVPALKTMLSDAVSQGVERLMFGDSRPRSSNRTVGYHNYSRYADKRPTPGSSTSAPPWRADPRTAPRPTTQANNAYNEIVLADRGDAEEVLDRLAAQIDEYDIASVSDLYDLVGLTSEFTDEKWGWTDIRGARVRRVPEGFLLELPRPSAISG